MADLFETVRRLDSEHAIVPAVALLMAFGFEVVKGFHDTPTRWRP